MPESEFRVIQVICVGTRYRDSCVLLWFENKFTIVNFLSFLDFTSKFSNFSKKKENENFQNFQKK